MLSINRLLWVGLLSAGISVATTARAGFQLFDGAWTVKSFGNECAIADTAPGAHCAGRTGENSEFYSDTAIPMGLKCNPYQPRCPFNSTPTTTSMTMTMGKNYTVTNFNPLGGSVFQALNCKPWANWRGMGTNMRPAKGETYLDPLNNNRPAPPLYRNPLFFTNTTTPNAQPDTYSCLGTSTDGFGGPGPVQLGHPVTGRWSAVTTGTQKGGFSFSAAPASVPTGLTQGVRVTGGVGEVGAIYPYVYSYTYATLRNNVGVFGPGNGPGDFSLSYTMGNLQNPPDGYGEALISVKQGAAKFGGTMRMLGALTTKVCYYRQGGCSLGLQSWRYDAVGASAYYDNTTGNGLPTENAAIAAGYIATYTAYYYHTVLMQISTIDVQGARFPWTTGSVTLTATGRGPHKTIHYAKGFDNRNTTTPNGTGTIQLVTPVLTRWLQPCCNWETGGVGIFRIKFVPEPQTWAMLVAGVLLLGVGTRMRRR